MHTVFKEVAAQYTEDRAEHGEVKHNAPGGLLEIPQFFDLPVNDQVDEGDEKTNQSGDEVAFIKGGLKLR